MKNGIDFSGILTALRQNKPLVHCITNVVTIGDCANALLAVGGSPVMAEQLEELEDFLLLASALVVNIGTPTPNMVDAFHVACKLASRMNVPIVLDPVGLGASQFRADLIDQLVQSYRITAIRGNISEINALCGSGSTTRGVDAAADDQLRADNLLKASDKLVECAQWSGAVIIATGEIDMATDGKRVYTCYNGDSTMPLVTGSGCMLSSIMGAFIGANPTKPLDSAVAALAHMGLAGERAAARVAKERAGSGSLRTYIIDNLGTITPAELERGARVDEIV